MRKPPFLLPVCGFVFLFVFLGAISLVSFAEATAPKKKPICMRAYKPGYWNFKIHVTHRPPRDQSPSQSEQRSMRAKIRVRYPRGKEKASAWTPWKTHPNKWWAHKPTDIDLNFTIENEPCVSDVEYKFEWTNPGGSSWGLFKNPIKNSISGDKRKEFYYSCTAISEMKNNGQNDFRGGCATTKMIRLKEADRFNTPGGILDPL